MMLAVTFCNSANMFKNHGTGGRGEWKHLPEVAHKQQSGRP